MGATTTYGVAAAHRPLPSSEGKAPQGIGHATATDGLRKRRAKQRLNSAAACSTSANIRLETTKLGSISAKSQRNRTKSVRNRPKRDRKRRISTNNCLEWAKFGPNGSVDLRPFEGRFGAVCGRCGVDVGPCGGRFGAVSESSSGRVKVDWGSIWVRSEEKPWQRAAGDQGSAGNRSGPWI